MIVTFYTDDTHVYQWRIKGLESFIYFSQNESKQSRYLNMEVSESQNPVSAGLGLLVLNHKRKKVKVKDKYF